MFKIITIPFDRNTKSFDEDFLNRVVVSKQVKTYWDELFHDGGETCWTIFLDYDPLVGFPLKNASAKKGFYVILRSNCMPKVVCF